mgnify:CR=1 FL=1
MDTGFFASGAMVPEFEAVAFSLEPGEFAQMADACRAAWQALGSERMGPAPAEVAQRRFRRSLYAVETIPAGTRITERHIASRRPGGGLHPRELRRLLGRRT